jgi:hypothetical protein
MSAVSLYLEGVILDDSEDLVGRAAQDVRGLV